MCFYNSLSKKNKELATRYGRKSDVIQLAEDILLEDQYRINAFQNPVYPIITESEEIEVAEWGLIPFWVKPKDNSAVERQDAIERAGHIRKGTYNARSETLFTLPSFRHAARRHRCLIPSTGYFEWRHEGKNKLPYYIFVKDLPIFSMGGVYDIWQHPETGEDIKTFALITTPANELTGYIHNGGKNPGRMPLILKTEDEERWLDPTLSEKEVKAMMKPLEAELMDAYRVHSDFLKKSPADRSVLEPYKEAGTLF